MAYSLLDREECHLISTQSPTLDHTTIKASLSRFEHNQSIPTQAPLARICGAKC